MIYTCPNCKEKVDETNCIIKANEDDSKEDLYCPYCDSKIASVIVNQGENASIKPEGFDIQDEYKIGARKLKVSNEPKKVLPEINVKDEKIMEELFTIKENKENLKSCNPLSDDEINSIIAEYKSDLIQENTSLNVNDIQILVDEKEADLRFNLAKATQAIENGRQWLINRGIKSLDDLEEEYSVLGLFDKFC